MRPKKIQPLTNPNVALSIYYKVFSAHTGYEILFKSQIPKRGIIFPINYVLKGEYLSAFVAAVAKTGEDSFYLSMTERVEASYIPKKGYEKEFSQAIREGKVGSENPFAESVMPIINDWFCPLEAVSTLLARDSDQDKHFHNLENAIYSVKGRWGLWFSNDGYAIVGGSEEFVKTFFDTINQTIEEMAVSFIRGTQNVQYAMDYLRPLFGADEAERYIKIYRISI